MKNENGSNEKPKVPAWLTSGVMSLDDMVEIIVANSHYNPKVVRQAMKEFEKVLYEKLKEGYSVKSAFGTFYPHFGEPDPITGDSEFSVEFVPTEDVLKKIETRKLERLNNISLN